MADSPNCDLVYNVGQDKPNKQAIDAYDQQHGTYSPKPMPEPDMAPSHETSMPFKIAG